MATRKMVAMNHRLPMERLIRATSAVVVLPEVSILRDCIGLLLT